MNDRCVGHPIPSGSFQSAAGKFLAHAYHLDWSLMVKFQQSRPDCFLNQLCRNPLAPLLKMKRNIERLTLIQETHCPIWMHWPRTTSAFATSDDPVNRVKSSPPEPLAQIELAKQWLAGEEANCCRILQEERQPLFSQGLVFYACPQPHVSRPVLAPRRNLFDILRSLCEKEPIKVRCNFDEFPKPSSFFIQIGASLKNIRHARAENSLTMPRESSFFVPC